MLDALLHHDALRHKVTGLIERYIQAKWPRQRENDKQIQLASTHLSKLIPLISL